MQKPLTKRHPFPLQTVAWSPDGTRIASAGISREVWIWDAISGRTLTIMRQQSPDMLMVAWSPDGTRLASAGKKGAIQLWDVATGRLLLIFGAARLKVRVLAWSPDGTTLASGSEDGSIYLWDIATGAKTFTLHQGTLRGLKDIYALGWSPNGRYLASSGESPDLCIWDVTTGELADWQSDTDCFMLGKPWKSDVGRLIGSYYGAPFAFFKGAHVFAHSHARSALPITCSPDGRYFVMARWGKTIGIWQAGTRIFSEVPLLYNSHTQMVTALEWSPDSSRIASASQDRTVHIWQPDLASVSNSENNHPLASAEPEA